MRSEAWTQETDALFPSHTKFTTSHLQISQDACNHGNLPGLDAQDV